MDGELCRDIIEHSNSGIFVAQAGDIIYANEQIQTLTGYTESELKEASKTKLIAPEDEALVESYHWGRLEDGSPPSRYDIALETADGAHIPVELSVSTVSYEGEPAVVAIARERERADRTESSQDTRALVREYKTVFENVQDALFLLNVDDEGTIRFSRINQREAEAIGKSSEQVRGKTPTEIFGEELGSELEANYRECIERQESITYEEELQFDDETTIWRTQLTPIVADGSVTQIVGVAREITELRESKRELKRKNDFLEQAQEIAELGAWETDIQNDEAWWTEKVNEIYGLPSDYEPSPREGIEYFHPDDQPKIRKAFERAVREDEPYDIEARIGDKNETSHWVRARGKAETENGDVVAVRGTLQDITERKEREQKLEQARSRLQVLFDEAPDTIVVHDEDGNILDANRQLVEELGYSHEELSSMNVTDYEVGLDIEEARDIWEGMDVGETAKVEGKHCRKEGSTFPVEVWVNKLELGGGPRYLAMARDISDRRQRERTLKRRQAFLENTTDIVTLLGEDGVVRYQNHCKEHFSGPEARDVTGKEPASIIHPDDIERAEETFESVRATPGATARNELRMKAKSGEWRWYSNHVVNLLDDPSVNGILVSSRDITERKEREQELEMLKERLELAVDGANLGVWDWDLSTDEVTFNDNWATMLGYDPDEIDSHLDEWEKRVHPDDRDIVEAALDEHITDQTEYYDTEHRMRTADGGWKWIRDVGKVVERDEKGDPARAVGIHIDIDDRKRAQQSLREERDMFTQGPAVVFKWRDAEGWPVEYVSENVTEVLGYTPEQLRSGEVPFSELVHDDDIDRVEREVEQNSDPGTARFSHEPYRVITADGDVRWVLDHTKNVRDDSEITHLLGYLIDITERKEREQELKYYERVINTFGDIATVIDPAGTISYVSPSVEQVLGYDPEELVGENGFEYQSPDTANAVEEAIEYVLEHPDELRTVQTKFRHADGSWCWIESTIQNRTDDDYIQGLLVNSRDITERKERERQLRQFREATEQAGHAVYITDPDGTIEYVNSAFEEITGFTEEEAIGQTPRILSSGEHDAEFYEQFWETLTSGERWESEMINQREDGEEVIFHQTVSPLTDDDGGIQKFVTVAQDITERKEYRKGLERAREELRQIIDLVPDLIFAKDREGTYLLANETTAEAYGLTPEAVEARQEHEIIPELEESEQYREDDLDVLESGEPKEIPEEKLTTADGETRILRTTKIPYEVPGSGKKAVLGYGRDITALKEYEETLERQRDNLQILNQMVRHDIRNNLQLIKSYAELLADDVESEYLDIILRESNNAVELTQTARNLATVMLEDTAELSPKHIGPVLNEQIDSITESYPEANISISDLDPVQVRADDMLPAVVRNLLKNAIGHNDKDTPVVEVSATRTNGDVRINIADNGPGIPDDQKEAIFGKEKKGLKSSGTGIGLYLVKTLVDRYEGEIWVEDNDPEGAAFCVKLPRIE